MSEQKDSPKPDDAMHPYGRCTCYGEGWCDWCVKPCPGCGMKWIICDCDPDDDDSVNARSPSVTGELEG